MDHQTQRSKSIELARAWFRLYRDWGYNPIPMREDDKRPRIKFACYWEKHVPEDLFSQFPTTSLQLMTGRFWRLMVIDLDGPEAASEFSKWGQIPRTWITHSGGNGRHLWFTLPDGLPPMHKAVLWKGSGNHSAIERLCDRSLIVVPPSIHPETQLRYVFDAKHNKKTIPMPAMAPRWLLNIKPPEKEIENKTAIKPYHSPYSNPEQRTQRAAVIASVRDKVSLAKSWGLRFCSHRPNPQGWLYCRAIGRRDQHPSASFHAESGIYKDHATGEVLSLFDVGVALGHYKTWNEAMDDIQRRF